MYLVFMLMYPAPDLSLPSPPFSSLTIVKTSPRFTVPTILELKSAFSLMFNESQMISTRNVFVAGAGLAFCLRAVVPASSGASIFPFLFNDRKDFAPLHSSNYFRVKVGFLSDV